MVFLCEREGESRDDGGEHVRPTSGGDWAGSVHKQVEAEERGVVHVRGGGAGVKVAAGCASWRRLPRVRWIRRRRVAPGGGGSRGSGGGGVGGGGGVKNSYQVESPANVRSDHFFPLDTYGFLGLFGQISAI
jgi:hypothetical protein